MAELAELAEQISRFIFLSCENLSISEDIIVVNFPTLPYPAPGDEKNKPGGFPLLFVLTVSLPLLCLICANFVRWGPVFGGFFHCKI